MSNILKGLNEGRNYGRDSWDSNMPGYQGDYGGAENFGRRNREWDEDDRIDARIRAEYEKKKEYEQNGKFWLKLKDSQRHLPAGPFTGKQAANTAAIELLKQQPELKGNLLITAYGPDETQGVAEGFFDQFRKKQQNYGGIDVSVEKEDNNILVKATANGRELGRVLFTPSEQDDNLLVPLDLEVDERYRGQGIGATMYDYVKSLGYTIRRSQYQTDAGAGFWDKHKSGKNVWEQGVAEGASIERKEGFRGRVTPDIEYIVRDEKGNIVRICKTKKEAKMWYDMVTLSKEEMWEKYPELKVNEGEQQLENSSSISDRKKIAKYEELALAANRVGDDEKCKLYQRKIQILKQKMSQGVAEGQLDELSPQTLASYKKKAGADATQADKRGDYARGNKRMSGIIKATKKEFDNDAKGVDEARYDSGDYYNARQGYEYGAKSPSVDSGAYEFDKEVQRNEPGGDRGRPKNLKGVSKTLPADAFGRITGKIPTGKTGRIHSMMGDVDEELDENLHKWFKEKWVRFGPDGKIRGDCARGDDSEGKPKCLPQSKAHSLGKKGRASAASRKRREDPNPERSGKAINVNTKKKSNEGVAEEKKPDFMKSGNMKPFTVSGTEIPGSVSTLEKLLLKAKEHGIKLNYDTIDKMMQLVCKKYNLTGDELHNQFVQKHHMIPDDWIVKQLDEACWKGYHKEGNKKMFGKTYPNCVKNTNEEQEQHRETCPHCGGEMVSEELMNEKKDACYYKVKSRYKVWPSAYASGALVKCRKKGADSWGNGGKKNKSIEEDQLDEKWTKKYKDSINCSNPKGFSQKAHCAGKKKSESAIMKGLVDEDLQGDK